MFLLYTMLVLIFGWLPTFVLTEKVCGTDLVTYESIKTLWLKQASGINLGIAGFGSCEEVCVSENRVCGSDARTYYNLCHFILALRRDENLTVRSAGYCALTGLLEPPPSCRSKYCAKTDSDSDSSDESGESYELPVIEKLNDSVSRINATLFKMAAEKKNRHRNVDDVETTTKIRQIDSSNDWIHLLYPTRKRHSEKNAAKKKSHRSSKKKARHEERNVDKEVEREKEKKAKKEKRKKEKQASEEEENVDKEVKREKEKKARKEERKKKKKASKEEENIDKQVEKENEKKARKEERKKEKQANKEESVDKEVEMEKEKEMKNIDKQSQNDIKLQVRFKVPDMTSTDLLNMIGLKNLLRTFI